MTPRQKPFAGLLAGLAAAASLVADTAPASAADRASGGGEAAVRLSPFVVTAAAAGAGRYASLESVSAGRMRTDLMDSAQSVSVITRELIDDVAPGRLLEAARYAAGIGESTLPTSWERTNVRGFIADGRTVDGFTYGSYPSYGFQNMDPALVDRIEIVKGPNSILAPQPSSPGGTLNLATKRPQFRDFGLAGVQAGSFDANSGFFDLNRAAGDRLAVRVVGSVRHWDNWWQGSYVHAATLMPEFTWRFSDRTEATFQYIYTDWKSQNYFGLPLDPSSGTATGTRLLAGVPRDLDVFADDVYRFTRQHEFRAFLTTEFGPGLQMRLAAAYNTNSQHGPQMNTGPSTTGFGGNIDPLTGNWVPGVQYLAAPPFTASLLPVPATRTFVRSGVELFADPRQFNLQNDYAWMRESAALKSTTLVGFACADLRVDDSKAYNLSAPPFAIDSYTDTPWTRGTVNFSQEVSNRFLQGYVAETAAFFQNRLILNAAGSWQSYRTWMRDRVSGATLAETHRTALPSGGVVFKPWPGSVSLYYSYAEQSSANAPLGGGLHMPLLSASRQNEFGARLKAWGDRLYLTVSHYAIGQENFSIPNPGNLRTPPPNPLLPPLYSDRRAEGWEYELRANPAANLSLIGSYTHFRNRDKNGVEFRGVAERSGALLASYTFARENIAALAGVRLAVGIDYLGRRPGDNTPGFTAASTPASPIPNQPGFYLEPRTLVNLTLAFAAKHHWGAQVNVDNLLDRAYLLASAGRSAVFPGPPRNIRFSIRRDF